MAEIIEIESVQDELDQARRNLRRTVAEVNRRVEHRVEEVAAHLSPTNVIEEHLPVATGLACAVGFTVGATDGRAMVVATLLLGGLIGIAFDAIKDHALADEA